MWKLNTLVLQAADAPRAAQVEEKSLENLTARLSFFTLSTLLMLSYTPFLWFNNNAEEAAEFYTRTFPDTKVTSVQRYGSWNEENAGAVMTMGLEIGGVGYTLLNGGPMYALTPAFSILVQCDNQEEVDRLWDALSAEGTAMQCGWITDKYGVTWQIVPKALFQLMSQPDREASQRVLDAMMQMVKISVPELEKASAGL